MAFWSGEKLARHLPGLITGFSEKNLDCASYRLCVGDQVFATSDKFASSAPTEALVSVLADPPKNILRIQPGQFAFLMTHENVRVPDDAIALISIRAGYKFKGLINVSGFHVDPGWEGKLIFSVYNAGPAEVKLERGAPMFLIVYADLDRYSTEIYTGASKGQTTIKSSLLENMTEQVFSPLMLQRKMNEQEDRRQADRRDMTDQLSQVEANTDAKLKVLDWLKAASFVLGGVMAALVAVVTAFPGLPGYVVATSLDVAGYEVKKKQPDSPPATSAEQKTSQLRVSGEPQAKRTETPTERTMERVDKP